jgi:hypothetical protein
MIPSPKLDDREFDDLVAEAMRLIPRYAPEWTHHNPADPGITLIELAAWMTDLILYRLNRVPEKNYVAFLNLLGIKLNAPQAARALLQFTLVEGAKRQVISAGTRVSTAQSADEETISFETERELVLTDVALDRCFSYFDETYADNSASVTGASSRPFEVFGGAQRVSRYLYLSDPRFAGCGDASVLRVLLGCPERGGRDLARLLEWEYWNGDRWAELEPAPVEVERGEVCFFGPLHFEPTAVNDVEGLWLRGRLAEIPEQSGDTEIDTVRARVEVVGEGVVPERALANLENDAYILLDLGKNAYPFGREPQPDCALYLACDELLETPEAELSVEVALADPAVIPEPAPSDDLTLVWEYFDSKRWRVLGRSGPRGTRPGSDEHGFFDETRALSQSGTIRFRRPVDMARSDVSGEEHFWFRVRIERGDYGVAGTYTLDNDKWVFRDDRPLRPPALRQLSLRYREEYRVLRSVLAFNDFRFADVTDLARKEYNIFQPFEPESDESPALYLGFERKLPNDALAIYLDMVSDLGPAGDDELDAITAELEKMQRARRAAWESEQRIVWEYWDGKVWSALPVDDGTTGFTSSGFVSFVAPDDWAACMKFTEERHWLRARLEHGGYVVPPRVARLLTNVVAARHQTTVRGEILGSSDASPMQQVELLRGPLLEGEAIWIKERQAPPGGELEELGEGAVRPTDEAGSEACWVRWKRVESFYGSGPRSRHYTIDYTSGRITFGEGRRGMIPPEGQNNLIADYRVGGGAAGNVNPHTLTSLTESIAYIDGVTNPLAASGGADRETVVEAKERAPYTIKSRDRAVTSEDFEMLALRASTSLARAKCIADPAARGSVTLVCVPKSETGPRDLARRLVPSNEVLRHVSRYLDERRLVGTMLRVKKPRYRDLSVVVTLIRRTLGTSDRLRREIEATLRRYLHPLVGGRDGRGWDFGRGVVKTELIQVVEEVQGVEGVDTLAMFDEERRIHVEQIRIDGAQLPHLVHVRVVEKVRDEIM